MKIEIYQINSSRDEDDLIFRGQRAYEGGRVIDLGIYDKVFTGKVPCNNLEDVYTYFQFYHGKKNKMRSMSVSDIVHVIGPLDSYFFCDDIGFIEIKPNEPLWES